MAGTTDTSRETADDPVLAHALAELAQETTEAPSSDPQPATQDEALTDPGANPTDPSTQPSDPAPTGDAGPQASQQQADAQLPSSDDDPLTGVEPIQVTIDGQSRTIEGFYRVPGQGIIIDEEKVPAFHLMASRAEGLERQNRDLYRQTQEYERLSQWTTTDPSTGTQRQLSGRDAIEARDVRIAELEARSSIAEAALLNPTLFAALVSVDAQGNVVPNVAQLEFLATRQQLAMRDAADQARSRFSASVQTHTQAIQQAQQTEQAPALFWQQAEQVWGKEFPQLTPDDKMFLGNQVGRYLRQASPAEVQGGQFKAGELVLDPSFYTVMQDRAQLRAQMTKVATTSQQAQQFNQGQQQGRKTPQPSRPSSSPASSPSPATRATKKPPQEQWDEVFESGMREMSPTL